MGAFGVVRCLFLSFFFFLSFFLFVLVDMDSCALCQGHGGLKKCVVCQKIVCDECGVRLEQFVCLSCADLHFFTEVAPTFSSSPPRGAPQQVSALPFSHSPSVPSGKSGELEDKKCEDSATRELSFSEFVIIEEKKEKEEGNEEDKTPKEKEREEMEGGFVDMRTPDRPLSEEEEIMLSQYNKIYQKHRQYLIKNRKDWYKEVIIGGLGIKMRSF